MNMPTTLKDIDYDTSKDSIDFYLSHIAADGNVKSEEEKAQLQKAVREIL